METDDRLGELASIPEKILLIKSLEYNIKRIKDGLDDYGNNEMTIKVWNRELVITRLEVWEKLQIFKQK
jgi:hypothetical protein